MRDTHPQTCLLLFSGGQDSATCLAWAAQTFARVETVGFTYGQRHKVEMTAREEVRKRFVAMSDVGDRIGEDHLINLNALGEISDTALTSEAEISIRADGLPNTFVPGRNLIFLTFAAALAYRRGIRDLVGGMCQEDSSGYPDCRRPALDAQVQALSLGMDTEFHLHTPLMDKTKADAWALAEQLGGVSLVRLIEEHSHTCYVGDRTHRHAWGYGCGTCPACELRARGHAAYLAGRARG